MKVTFAKWLKNETGCDDGDDNDDDDDDEVMMMDHFLATKDYI